MLLQLWWVRPQLCWRETQQRGQMCWLLDQLWLLRALQVQLCQAETGS